MDKPAGPTSHDAVAAARRALGERRVGHAGTLDPGASGLLVVLVGRATRLARFVAMLPKRYTGTVRFGFETDTDDAAGEPLGLPSDGWRALAPDAVARALAAVADRPLQVPPAVSAKKVDGERAYRRVRRGEAPALAPVPVTIHALEADTWEGTSPDLGIRVVCSSGTYVRAIARDLGRALGVGAHLAALRRTGIGPWNAADAAALTAPPEALRAALRPMAEAVAHLPRLDLDAADADRLAHGRKVATAAAPGPVAVYGPGGLVAVAGVRGGLLHPDVVLAA